MRPFQSHKSIREPRPLVNYSHERVSAIALIHNISVLPSEELPRRAFKPKAWHTIDRYSKIAKSAAGAHPVFTDMAAQPIGIATVGINLIPQ